MSDYCFDFKKVQKVLEEMYEMNDKLSNYVDELMAITFDITLHFDKFSYVKKLYHTTNDLICNNFYTPWDELKNIYNIFQEYEKQVVNNASNKFTKKNHFTKAAITRSQKTEREQSKLKAYGEKTIGEQIKENLKESWNTCKGFFSWAEGTFEDLPVPETAKNVFKGGMDAANISSYYNIMKVIFSGEADVGTVISSAVSIFGKEAVALKKAGELKGQFSFLAESVFTRPIKSASKVFLNESSFYVKEMNELRKETASYFENGKYAEGIIHYATGNVVTTGKAVTKVGYDVLGATLDSKLGEIFESDNKIADGMMDSLVSKDGVLAGIEDFAGINLEDTMDKKIKEFSDDLVEYAKSGEKEINNIIKEPLNIANAYIGSAKSAMGDVAEYLKKWAVQ